jgi:hypothetical protein
MRYTQHLRTEVRDRLAGLASEMRAWQDQPSLSGEEKDRLGSAIQLFSHTTRMDDLCFAGVDGSGDYPCLTYADSFIYVTVAQGATYRVAPASGLREQLAVPAPAPEFTWLPNDPKRCREEWYKALERLAGRPLRSIIERSDYRTLKATASGRDTPVDQLYADLLCPQASDSGNIAIQLRTTAELGLAYSIIDSDTSVRYVLVDTTFSLPFVTRRDVSLFYEHLKRLCCVRAHQRGIGFFAISKSHGLPAIELLEDLARAKAGLPAAAQAEHWYLRIPTAADDGWVMTQLHERQVPPIGAVSYLVRFHRNVPVLRLDVDRRFWDEHVRSDDDDITRQREAAIFEHLDYASHDQRSYGYPYPLKSGHDRASLTQAERAAFRRQVIDAAIAVGMRRSLFRDASIATGHR